MTQAGQPAQTIHARQSASPPAPRARLISSRLALLLMASFGALTSFFLLLSVTPMYAAAGGAGTSGAGLVTGSLMLATVVAELASARLMRRYGYRLVFAAGALLLGGPTLALLASHSVAAIVAVSIARGIGFGLNTVVIGALVAAVLPADRRGEGIGLAVFSPRRDPADMVGDLGQVRRQRRQFAARAGRQGRAQTLVKLGRGQPSVASRNTEDLDHPVPVFIGGPQLRLGASTGTSCRREIIARHGHILHCGAFLDSIDGERCTG